jgi:oxepin-CoA hydrolase / 3-oxo-5,6-dehydrosuberyl-CoA semialdehyde dehydrogenase
MGSVISLDHREDVRRAVRQIADAGRLVHGDPDKVEVIDADSRRGAFLDTILIAVDGDQTAPHEVEPFGPVASILGYRNAIHAADLVARGRGSLAASVASDDLSWTTSLIRELAPWHGRLHILDSDDMDHTTGHGSPLPALRHGGPGRAGGGSEMAGLHGVLDLMQRTALAASPRLLGALQKA